MKAMDFLKALGVAIGILILNVAISFAVVFAYSLWVDPGHDDAYYQAAAQWIAPWSSIAFGWLLFLLATFVLSRKPDRDALVFAVTAFAFYAAVDLSIVGAAGALSAFGPIIALSLSSKLVGAIAGVGLAGR
jgi:hypothetical protein